jgi:hypothetical protein
MTEPELDLKALARLLGVDDRSRLRRWKIFGSIVLLSVGLVMWTNPDLWLK